MGRSMRCHFPYVTRWDEDQSVTTAYGTSDGFGDGFDIDP